MELSKGLIKEMLGCYLQTTFAELLPSLISEALNKNDLLVFQNFCVNRRGNETIQYLSEDFI